MDHYAKPVVKIAREVCRVPHFWSKKDLVPNKFVKENAPKKY
jgi:hypothetical protein